MLTCKDKLQRSRWHGSAPVTCVATDQIAGVVVGTTQARVFQAPPNEEWAHEPFAPLERRPPAGGKDTSIVLAACVADNGRVIRSVTANGTLRSQETAAVSHPRSADVHRLFANEASKAAFLSAACFNQDGTRLACATVADPPVVHVFQLEPLVVGTTVVTDAVMEFTFSEESASVDATNDATATSCAGVSVAVSPLRTISVPAALEGAPQSSDAQLGSSSGPVRCLRFSPEGKYFTADAVHIVMEQCFLAVSVRTGATLYARKPEDGAPCSSLAVSPDGSIIAVGTCKPSVGLYEAPMTEESTTRKVAHLYTLDMHVYAPKTNTFVKDVLVFETDFNPTRYQIFAVSEPGLQVWDLESKELVLDSSRRSRAWARAAWSQDGKRLFAGDNEGEVYVFEEPN